VQRVLGLPYPTSQSQLWLTEVNTANQGSVFPRSYLTVYTIGVRLSGQRSTLYRHQRFTTGGGSFIVYQPGEVLASRSTDSASWHHWSLNFLPEQLGSLLTHYFEMQKAVWLPNMLTETKLNAILARAFMQLVDSAVISTRSLETESRFLGLLRLTLQQMAETKPEQPTPKREAQKVELMKSFIRDNLAQVISFSELSALVNISPDYLSRVFKREVGVSLHVYQTCLRLQRAKRLLLNNVSISEVALQLGFSDQSHFQRVFKKHTLLTPLQFKVLFKQ
jgi:AraC-like DNA-binding protein